MAAFASSYIPTGASTVTRSADVASVDTLSPWYNATQGTLYSELNRFAANSDPRGPIIHDGTTNNYIGSTLASASGNAGYVVSGASSQAALGAGNSNLGVSKIAFAFAANDFAVAVNGGSVSTDTSGSIPAVTTLGLGSITSSYVGTGHLRRIAYYPRRLTNAELQALSA